MNIISKFSGAGDICRTCDFHTHTTYSDGANTAEEMIIAAIGAGLALRAFPGQTFSFQKSNSEKAEKFGHESGERMAIGISDHSYTPFDESYCMKAGAFPAYCAEIAALKEKYKGKIEVFCGIEQDYYSGAAPSGIDYAIGSVHYIKAGDEYIPADEGSDVLLRGAERHFGGDVYALAEEYYRTVGNVIAVTGASIIGHFDLIAKFNEREPIFDEKHPRYIAAWRSAADALLRTGVPFEINTGALARGYRSTPYPSPDIREYIAERGGKFIISSDSHSTEMLRSAPRDDAAGLISALNTVRSA